MSSRERTFGGRLLALPGQFLLALINATAILVFVACVLVLMTMDRIETAGASLADAAAGAALARLEMTPQEFQSRIANLDQRMDEISLQLQDPIRVDVRALRPELEALNANFSQVANTAKVLSSAQPEMVEAAMRQAGQTVTDTLLGLTACGKTALAEAAPGS